MTSSDTGFTFTPPRPFLILCCLLLSENGIKGTKANIGCFLKGRSWSEKRKRRDHHIGFVGFIGMWTFPTINNLKDWENLGKMVTENQTSWGRVRFEYFTLWCSFQPSADWITWVVVYIFVLVFPRPLNLKSWSNSSWNSWLQGHHCTQRPAGFTTLFCKKFSESA